jgi:hypothetical protein
MKCDCGWEGELATVTYMDHDWQLTSAPMCLYCRLDYRQALRRRGLKPCRVVPCRA